MEVDAEVRAGVGSEPAVRGWNVAAVWADKATELARGREPDCLGCWQVQAGWEGGLHLDFDQPAGGSGDSWDLAGQGSSSAA